MERGSQKTFISPSLSLNKGEASLVSSFINWELLQSRAEGLRGRVKPPLCPVPLQFGSCVRDGIVGVEGSHSPWQEELVRADGAAARGFAAVFVEGVVEQDLPPQLSRE